MDERKIAAKSGEPLIEGRDYKLENGLFVLTREYLLGRGRCCGSGCRNCPYPDLASPKTPDKVKMTK